MPPWVVDEFVRSIIVAVHLDLSRYDAMLVNADKYLINHDRYNCTWELKHYEPS